MPVHANSIRYRNQAVYLAEEHLLFEISLWHRVLIGQHRGLAKCLVPANFSGLRKSKTSNQKSPTYRVLEE